jgi:hypothetical protein
MGKTSRGTPGSAGIDSSMFPPHHNHFLQAIEDSRRILDLSDNWDDEGSPGYERGTWERAVRFLCEQARFAFHRLDEVLDAPEILPGPDGSIDVHWKKDNYELLVNIPNEPGEPAEYYGDNGEEVMPIRGSCDPAQPDRKLISWLTLMRR